MNYSNGWRARSAMLAGLALSTVGVGQAAADMMVFLVDHEISGGAAASVRMTLDDESDPGCIQITAEVLDPMGDLRGIFFHVSDESLLPSMTVYGADVNDWEFMANSVDNLGGGANFNGGSGNQGPFDVGVQIGTPGVGHDDISMTTFTLCSSEGPLDLTLLADQFFGVRLTSVGPLGSRDGSSKLQAQAPSIPEPTTGSLTLGLLGSSMMVRGRRPRKKTR